MNRLLRTAALIVLAMLGSAILLAGLISLATRLTVYAKTPADFLAASDTIALLQHPDEQTIEQWSDIYPALTTLPAKPYDAVAIVKRDAPVAIGFTISKTASPDLVGPFALTTSTKGASIDPQAPKLAETPSYAALAQHMKNTNSWTYVRIPKKQQSLSGDILRTFISGSSDAVAIELRDGTLVSTTPDLRKEQHRSENAFPDITDAALTLSLTNGNASWQEFRSSIPDASGIITEGILRALLTSYGDDLSLNHDLLTILSQPSTLNITATGAQVGMLLSGQHNNIKELNQILDTFHTAYTNTLPATKVTKRILDKRFSSIDIRHDESMIEDWQQQEGQWRIRGTSHKDMRNGLYTAAKGSLYRISNLSGLIRIPEGTLQSSMQPGGIELLSLALHGEKTKTILDTIATSAIFPKNWYAQPVSVRSVLGNGVRTVEMKGTDNPLSLIESLVF